MMPYSTSLICNCIIRVPSDQAPCRGCNFQPTLPVHLLDGPAVDLQELGQFPLADSLRSHPRMYSRCCSVRLGRRPGKRPSARAFAWPATERSLIELRHHSLKASTIESWSLPVDVAVSKSSYRDRNSTPIRCRPSGLCRHGSVPGERRTLRSVQRTRGLASLALRGEFISVIGGVSRGLTGRTGDHLN